MYSSVDQYYKQRCHVHQTFVYIIFALDGTSTKYVVPSSPFESNNKVLKADVRLVFGFGHLYERTLMQISIISISLYTSYFFILFYRTTLPWSSYGRTCHPDEG